MQDAVYDGVLGVPGRGRREGGVDRHPRRQFRIGRCLGRGGFGEVYVATMRSPGGLETEVAVKVLRDDLGLDNAAVRRIRDEGRLLSRVRHPALLQVYDLTRIDGRIGLVTEYVDGEDLDGCAHGPRGLDPRAAVQVIRIVAAGLGAAWATPGPDGTPLAIVHRDVKPTNIRIGRHGQVKLLDFGIARFTSADREARTLTDMVVGSVPYLAPERLAERASLPAGDVYGLGCCLFEVLTGERFHADSSLRTVSALGVDGRRYGDHLARRLEALQRRPGATGPTPLLARMLAFDPSDRPTADEVAGACDELDEVLPGLAVRRWCAERTTWSSPPLEGSLQGRTLTEGELGIDPADPMASSPPGDPPRERPRLIHRPLGTVDPRVDELEPEPAASPPPAQAATVPVASPVDRAGQGSVPPNVPRGSLPPRGGSLPPRGSSPPTPPPPPPMDGLALRTEVPKLASRDSLDRVRPPPEPPSGGGLVPVAVGVGCAAVVVALAATLAVVGVAAVWFGLG